MKTPELVVKNVTFSEFSVHSAWYADRLGDGYLLYLVRTGTKPSMEF